MRTQQAIDFLQGQGQAGFEVAGLEGLAHARQDRVPGRLGHFVVQSPIGDDLDAALGQQQVDQHAVVVFGVPDPQFAEDVR